MRQNAKNPDDVEKMKLPNALSDLLNFNKHSHGCHAAAAVSVCTPAFIL